ncbi:MAG: SLC13 family permease [Candidatus Anstonellaceae archaeon]
MEDLFVLFIFFLSIFLIFFRNLFGNIEPWKIMASAAFLLIATDNITINQAIEQIDWSVIGFLYFMFVFSKGLEESGYLNNLLAEILSHFKKPFWIFCSFVFLVGVSSALLLNDTIAIIGSLSALLLAKINNINPTPLIVALVIAITIGSSASPIGNPQNFIIASSDQFSGHNPFIIFFEYLAIPTIFSLGFLSLLLWYFFPSLQKLSKTPHKIPPLSNDYKAAKIGFYTLILLSVLRIFFNFPLFFIAFGVALIYLLLTPKKQNIFKADFKTLIFFIGMFILMGSLFNTAAFKKFFSGKENLSNPLTIILSSLFFSQFLSNVPFVILYLKTANFLSINELILLAASSTLAANITIFGGASNIIVLQTIEQNKIKFPLKEFVIFGISSTIFYFLFLLSIFKFL